MQKLKPVKIETMREWAADGNSHRFVRRGELLRILSQYHRVHEAPWYKKLWQRVSSREIERD